MFKTNDSALILTNQWKIMCMYVNNCVNMCDVDTSTVLTTNKVFPLKITLADDLHSSATVNVGEINTN
jgi:hypothetical protein